jgi:diadenosine tetraphosphate (Ap4A) HIT family hydrolase
MAATPSSENSTPACPLCATDGGKLVWRNERLRVILPEEPDFPGFTRVVWNRHLAEMTDLSAAQREHLMSVVWMVEAAQREALAPHKINLASFGNFVAHLHWHVIPRWRDDSHFPESVWGPRAQGRAEAASLRKAEVHARLPKYLEGLLSRLA